MSNKTEQYLLGFMWRVPCHVKYISNRSFISSVCLFDILHVPSLHCTRNGVYHWRNWFFDMCVSHSAMSMSETNRSTTIFYCVWMKAAKWQRSCVATCTSYDCVRLKTIDVFVSNKKKENEKIITFYHDKHNHHTCINNNKINKYVL